MSASEFETVLARLYTDQDFRQRFLQNMSETLSSLDLSTEEKSALLQIDQIGLVMAAKSFNHKKNKRKKISKVWWRRIFQ